MQIFSITLIPLIILIIFRFINKNEIFGWIIWCQYYNIQLLFDAKFVNNSILQFDLTNNRIRGWDQFIMTKCLSNPSIWQIIYNHCNMKHYSLHWFLWSKWHIKNDSNRFVWSDFWYWRRHITHYIRWYW